MRSPSSSIVMALGYSLKPGWRSKTSVAMPACPSRLAAARPVGPAPTITTATDVSIGVIADFLIEGQNDVDAANAACTKHDRVRFLRCEWLGVMTDQIHLILRFQHLAVQCRRN